MDAKTIIDQTEQLSFAGLWPLSAWRLLMVRAVSFMMLTVTNIWIFWQG